jgi:hypothetical protein
MGIAVGILIGLMLGVAGEKWAWKSKVKQEPEAGVLVDGIVYSIVKSKKQLEDF